MKTNSNRKILLVSVLSLLMALCVALGVAFIKNTNKANAEGSTYLKILDGISLKLDTTNDVGGMRFEAQMDTTTGASVAAGTYTMYFVIAPTAGFDYYYNQSKTIVDMANAGDAVVITVDKDKVYPDDVTTPTCYYAQACVTNILAANRNLSFESGAYIMNGDTQVAITTRNSTATGTFYDKTNKTVINQEEVDEVTMSMNAYNSWYGTSSYPVNVETQTQCDTIVAKCNDGDKVFKNLTIKYDPETVVWDSSRFNDTTTAPQVDSAYIYDFTGVTTQDLFSQIDRSGTPVTEGTGRTLTIEDTTDLIKSDKVSGNALKVETTDAGAGDIAIKKAYLDNVFSDPQVTAVAFDIYIISGTTDLRFCTTSRHADTNYYYVYPETATSTTTLIYTREIYNKMSPCTLGDYVCFFYAGSMNFYIDNVRALKGSVQDNYYYGFEQTCVRLNSGTNLLVPGNTTTWQVRAGGGAYTMSIDTEITNNSAASLKIDYTASSGEKQFVFNSTSVAWYTALKDGFSFDIYSTIDIPYNYLVNNAYNSYGISLKANTWNTVYVSASDISGTACIYRIKTGIAACKIYLDNIKPITEDEYNQAILGIEAGRLRDDVSQTYYYYDTPDIATVKYSIAVVSSNSTISDGTFDGITHSGIHSFGCTKSSGYISYMSSTSSDFYSRIKDGFTVWVYSTVEIPSKYVKDGANGLLNVTIPANTWTQLTIPASGVNSGGRFFIIDANSPAGTIYLDDFVPSGTTEQYVVTLKNGTKTSTQTVTCGSSATKPADPTKTKTAKYTYTFDGWYNGNTKFDFSTPITQNITLYARFTETINTYDVTIKTTFGSVSGKDVTFNDVEYGTKLDLSVLDNDLATYKLYDGDTQITEYTVTGNNTLNAIYTSKVYDFEDGTNSIMSEVQRRASAAGSGHTLEVVSFTGTSDKVTRKALKVVTVNQDNGDIAILDSFLTTAFADSNVSAVAFDVYLETQASGESIDIRMSTSSTDASTSYRYLYPKQYQTGTIFYTRANYNEKSNYVYNGFRQMFFNRYADTFYIDNVRVCYGETAQVNQYYTFEQTSIRHNSDDGGASYIYPGNLPGTWQVAVTGNTNAATFDTTVTNGCATSIKIPNIDSASVGVVFNYNSNTWYDVFKSGLSVDIYSTVYIPCTSLLDGTGYIGEVKAYTWTTVYVPASHLSSSRTIFKLLNMTGATVYFCNLKTATDAEYQAYLAKSLSFEMGGTTFSSNTGYYFVGAETTSSYSLRSGNSTILTSFALSNEQAYSGNYSLKITKEANYLPFYMHTSSYFYSKLSSGFTVWVYSTVAIASNQYTDGKNVVLGTDIPANTWTKLTFSSSNISSDGRWLIFNNNGTPATTVYFDCFAPIA